MNEKSLIKSKMIIASEQQQKKNTILAEGQIKYTKNEQGIRLSM